MKPRNIILTAGITLATALGLCATNFYYFAHRASVLREAEMQSHMKYGRALSEKKKTLSEMRQSGQEYTPERDNELFPRLSRFETETDELAKKAADAERRAINPFYSLKRVFE